VSTFVLVHGSMHGGWCWTRVVPLLRAAGNDVYTPTLTGLGERVHLAHPGIDLDTHIQDVLGVLEFEDLHDVALVGQSYGAMVITGVADRVPGRIGHLVYLDGAMPSDGQAVLDLSPPEWGASRRAQVDAAVFGGPKTFIACLEAPPTPWREAMTDRVRAEHGWRYRGLATGHDAMITAPRALAELLLEIAEPAF
jgi:pimeloyl-ACP methyl ester carboxylesterase